MTEAKSVKISYDVAGGDFDRAGEASSGIKRMLQKIGIPALCRYTDIRQPIWRMLRNSVVSHGGHATTKQRSTSYR